MGKKDFLKISLSLFAIFSFIIIEIIFNSSFVLNPFNINFKPKGIKQATIDSSGNFIFVDLNADGYERLVKTDPEGKIKFIIDGGDREGLYSFINIETDDEDNIYVINTIPNIDDGMVESTEISMFSPSGSVIRSIFKKTYSDIEREKMKEHPTIGIFFHIYIINNKIYFLDQYDINKQTIYSTDRSGKKPEMVKEIFSSVMVNDWAINRNEELLIIDSKLDLLRIKNNFVKKINIGNDFIYQNVFTNGKDFILLDTYSQSIGVIDTANCYTKILDRNALIDSGKISKNFIFTVGYVKCINDTLVLPDRENNQIFLHSQNGIKFINSFTLAPSVIFIRIFLWIILFAIFATAAFISYILYSGILNRRIPIIIKQLIIFLPVIVISVLTCSWIVYQESYKMISNEYQTQFLIYAQNASDKIDGDLFENIQGKNGITSKEYIQLISQMKGIINNRKDEWDKNLFTYIYKFDKQHNIQYGFGDIGDYYWPYLIDGMNNKRYMNAFENKTVSASTYSDYTGDWISGVSPIYNHKKDVIGVFEVYGLHP